MPTLPQIRSIDTNQFFNAEQAGRQQAVQQDALAKLTQLAQLAQQGDFQGAAGVALSNPSTANQGLNLLNLARQGKQFEANQAVQNKRLGLEEQRVGLSRENAEANRGLARAQFEALQQQRATQNNLSRQSLGLKRDALAAKTPQGGAISKGQEAFDKQAAKDLAPFIAGGFADAEKQVADLDGAIAQLKSGDDSLTGPIMGNTPDALKAFTPAGQRALAIKDRVESVVQRNLRLILGAQFTEREGTRLIQRAFNPRLGEAENAKRLTDLRNQMVAAIQAKREAAKYLEENGTLRGFSGKIPTFSDFARAADGKGVSIAPKATQPEPQAETQPQVQDGQTATGPNGQRIIFQGGQWRPIDAQ